MSFGLFDLFDLFDLLNFQKKKKKNNEVEVELKFEEIPNFKHYQIIPECPPGQISVPMYGDSGCTTDAQMVYVKKGDKFWAGCCKPDGTSTPTGTGTSTGGVTSTGGGTSTATGSSTSCSQ